MNNKETTMDINLSSITLDELLISLGGVLFAGAEVQEIDTPLLVRLEDLIKAEILIRESGLRKDYPKDTIPNGSMIYTKNY